MATTTDFAPVLVNGTVVDLSAHNAHVAPILVDGVEVARCASCGDLEGTDLYPQETAAGYPSFLVVIRDGLCAVCHDEARLARGEVTACALGYVACTVANGCRCS